MTTSLAATAPSPAPAPTAQSGATAQALLVVSLQNLDVRYASQRAVDCLGLPAGRLLGRSLLLSLPPLGQALTLAIAAGMSPMPTRLNLVMADTDGTPLDTFVHQRDSEAIVEFRPADGARPAGAATPASDTATFRRSAQVPDPIRLQRRLDEMRQDLVALRSRIHCDERMLRGDDPLLFWLWQAEAALTQISQRANELVAVQRPQGTSTPRTP